MLRREDLDARSWWAILEELDWRIEAAVEDAIRGRFLGAGELATGFSELVKLRRGREPDYDRAGVAVAYAFRYLPQRVACILGALTLVANRAAPQRVLDLGSGSGAGLLALDLWAADSSMEVVSLEPSSDMQEFARGLFHGPQIAQSHLKNNLADLLSERVALEPQSFDLVLLSACLPYGYEHSTPLAEVVGQLTRPPAAIIIIEPQAKKAELQKLSKALVETGYYSAFDYCCHDLPEQIRYPRMLTRLTLLLQHYEDHVRHNACLSLGGRTMLGDPAYPAKSWNGLPSYKDRVLLCLEGD
jgi:SAM-dependent methyltransferase